MKKWMLFFGFCIVASVTMAQTNVDCNTGSVSADQTICSGTQPNALSIVGFVSGANLQWQHSSDNNIFSDLSGKTSPLLSPGVLTNSAYYRVKVSAGNTCDQAYSETITITVDAPPVAGTVSLMGGGSSIVICEDEAAALVLTGHTGDNIQWQKTPVSNPNGWAPIPGATEVSYTVSDLQASHYYRVRVKNGVCLGVFSNSFTVTVITTSVAGAINIMGGGSNSTCEGSSVTLELNGHTGDNIQWYETPADTPGDWSIITGATGSTYTTANNQSTQSYKVSVQNGTCSEVFSDPFLVSVYEPSVGGNIGLESDQTICQDGSATFSLEDYTGDNIQWQKATADAPDLWTTITTTEEPLDFYTITNIQTSHYYRVSVQSGTCTAEFSNKILIIVDIPPTAPTGIAGAIDPICNGTEITLSAEGVDEESGADYLWGWGNVPGENPITTTSDNDWEVFGLTTDTIFWVQSVGASVCTDTISTGAFVSVTVRPVPEVSITDPSELCQLSGQQIVITNETVGQSQIAITWEGPSGQGGVVNNVTDNVEILLDLTGESDSGNINILSYEFSDLPACTNENQVSVNFVIKPRPAINMLSHMDDDETNQNPLCQGYGPVKFNISSSNVGWSGSYFVNDLLIEESISAELYSLRVDSVGAHNFVIDTLWYNTELACGYNPADYEQLSFYSDSVTIKPTPPAVELDGTPSILQFCDYAAPLVLDSVAKVDNLNTWVDNEDGYTIKWKSSNDNSAADLNNIPLVSGGGYYPIFELGGCHSKLNTSSLPLIVDLMPLPDLQQSSLVFPTNACSGTTFDILFDPSENINHFGIADFEFDAPLSTPNISDTLSYHNFSGSNFSIDNSSDSASSWAANIYAQNKNTSTVNPVTCWAEPIAITIMVNPNPTFTPTSDALKICQNEESLELNPEWNGVGTVVWDFDEMKDYAESIVDTTNNKVTIILNGDSHGTATITAHGEYESSGCSVDKTFTITIHPTPQFETRLIDIDNTICHNEYTHIEIVEPNPNFEYQWECRGCNTKSVADTIFLPHWINETAGGSASSEGTYTIIVKDTTTGLNCSDTATKTISVLPIYASCPEGIDFFKPHGLSLVDAPAEYFQWYEVKEDNTYKLIEGATDQTYFKEGIDSCNTSEYIVTSSLDGKNCWSTTVNCFEEFYLRDCSFPKSKSNESGFLLYPNPVVESDIILENLDLDLKGRYTVELISITGQTLMSRIVNIEAIGQKRIELPKTVTGIYLFRVSNAKYIQTFKLIIN